MSLNSKLKRILIDLEDLQIDCWNVDDVNDLEDIIYRLRDIKLSEQLI